MASAAVAKRRGSAYTERLAAKQRRQKVIVGVLAVVLAALLAYEVPHTLKLLNGSSATTAAPVAPASACERSTGPTRSCRAAGFPRARTIEALTDLELQLPAIVDEDGPALTVLRLEPEEGFLRTPPMTYEGPEMKYRFGRALERRFGIEVFGPQGY